MIYKIFSWFVPLYFFLNISLVYAEDVSPGTFGDWRVSVLDDNTDKYIKLWTMIPNTSTIFEIFLDRNKGYRYYEPEDQVEVAFTKLIDPVIYKQEYASAEEVKKVGSFSLDEVIYPVGLNNQDSAGELITYVEDLPDDFLSLLSDSNILMFRQVSGINYMIPLNGFKEALAYANSLRNNYDDPSRHPCYPLLPLHKI